MNMYEVCAKCGHVGRNYYIDKVFVVRAETAKEAARIVRGFPRVKHHHKDAIRYVRKIDETRYWEVRKWNNIDPYFSCHNIQEQRRTCEITPICERPAEAFDEPEDVAKKRFYDGKKAIKNPKRYFKNNNKEIFAA